MSDKQTISSQLNPAASGAFAGNIVAPAAESLRTEQYKESVQGLSIQRKLSIGSTNDPLEHEADAIADKVMRMPESSFIQRKCAHCEEEKAQRKPLVSFIQRKETSNNNHTVSDAVANNIQASNGSGNAMPSSTKSFMESRFGVDFSNVCIHADNNAAQLSNQLNAQAFTFGKDIYFNDGKYQPETFIGKQLLAHELVHTVQQSPQQVMRFPYETRGMALSSADIATMAGQSYWEQRTGNTFDLTVDRRMAADAEERDAVLSAFWGMNPVARITAHSVKVVPVALRVVPATATTPQTPIPQLLYRITFDPPAAAGGKPRVAFRFIANGPAATPVIAQPAPSTFTPTQPGSWTESGFPTNMTDYFTAFPEEHKALFNWLENVAPASFDQVVTTSTTTTGRRGSAVVSHRSVFKVSGNKSGTAVSSLTINLASETGIEAMQTAPADYRDRDRGDLELERLQARTPAAARLGSITYSGTIPADERLAVKYAIWQYFEFGNARSTEVDTIVPLTAARNVLYTLTFGARNNISVLRIGETGTATGMINTQRIDVTRVQGFPGATASTAVLQTWWSARYKNGGALPHATSAASGTPAPATSQPAGAPAAAAPTPADLINDMNTLISAGIGNATWFNLNYGMEVLDQASLATRLQTVHSVPATMTTDTINFDATDLLMLELSLQTLSDSEIARLNGIKLGRKTASITATVTHGNITYSAGNSTQYGLTLTDGTATPKITVLYFQSLYSNNNLLFRGSTAANALPQVAGDILHELGHAEDYKSGIAAAFNTWFRTNHQTAPTWYAASGQSELFPEALALYHTDPHFLCSSSPLTYAWLDQLVQTGIAPAATAHIAAPTACP